MLRKQDPQFFADYLQDSSGLGPGHAAEIVFPDSPEEAAAIIAQCYAQKQPITLAGGGTGIVGGRIPQGGVIVATDRLNRILDISPRPEGGGIAVVEPGVRLTELSEAVSREGFFYLPDPTEKKAFIGGTVATNASGARGFRYGSTRNYVRALRLVLPGGAELDVRRGEHVVKEKLELCLPGRQIRCALPSFRHYYGKNSAGYFLCEGSDLIDLFIGQEGTLAMVTRIELDLVIQPRGTVSAMVFFQDESAALAFVRDLKIRSLAGRRRERDEVLNAGCIEYFDRFSLDILRPAYPQLPQAGAAIYFDQDDTADCEMQIMEAYAEACRRQGVTDDNIWFVDSPRKRQQLAAIRYDLPVMINERVRRNGFAKLSTDIAVADEAFPALVLFIRQELSRQTIPYAIFGHIAENHLHLNLMPQTMRALDAARALYESLMVKTVALGGTIAAEHGIGKLKQPYLHLMFGDEGVSRMRAVKQAFDPLWLLGRGTLFAAPEPG